MKISKRNIRLIVAWVCIIAIVLSLVPDRLSRTVEAVGDESGVESVESVPTDPESTPETPTEPESTPETPTEPESTPETPTEPESTPETPAEPESTPETPEKTGQSDTIDQHQSGTTGQGQSGETEKDNTTETEIKVDRTVQVNTTPELNSDFKGRVGDSVTIEINITDEDAHDGKYTVLWKDNGKEIKEDEEKKTEITYESENKKTVLKYNYVIPYAGKHIVTAVISDENDASYKEEKNVDISGSISFNWEPKDSNSLKRDKAWKLKSTPVGKDYYVFWYVGSLEENQTDLVGYLRGKEESGSDDKNIEMDAATDDSESFFAEFEYAPGDTEPHTINIVAVPKTLTSGNSGVIRASKSFEASPYDVNDISIENIEKTEAGDEKIESVQSLDKADLHTGDSVKVTFIEQVAEGKYTVEKKAGPAGAGDAAVDSEKQNIITFPTNVEGDYSFKVKYTVDQDGLDKEANPPSKETDISYTVKKKVNVSLAEGAKIKKDSDGTDKVLNVTPGMFIIDGTKENPTSVNTDNWKYESSGIKNDIKIIGVKPSDFTFTSKFYDVTVSDFTGDITANKPEPDNDTIDLTAENINAEDYSLKVNDDLAIKVRKDYRSLLGTAGWFKEGLKDGNVIELSAETAEFVKAEDFTSAYEFATPKEGVNTQENIYVKTAENAIYGPYKLIYQYDSELPDYEVKITKTENIFFGLIKLDKKAEFGTDFTATDDGAVIVTDKEVTFTLKGAKDVTSRLKICGIYASETKLTTVEELDGKELMDSVTLGGENSSDGKYYLYVKLEDNAENTTYQALNGAVLTDKTAPTATITFTSDTVSASEHKAVLSVAATDSASGISKISAVLYDGIENDIVRYMNDDKAVEKVESYVSTNLVTNEFFYDMNAVKEVRAEDWTWELTSKGAQLSILIAVSDWAGNTVYYDQTGAKINDSAEEATLPADYAAAEKVFKETRKLGENTFIVYGTPAVIVKTNETKDAIEATIDGEKKYIFQDLSNIELNFSDMAGKASLEFNGTEYLEGEYNVEKHEYVYNSVALESVEGKNTFKLIVPQGTSVKKADKEFSDEPYVTEETKEGSVTYEGSFIYDNVAPTYDNSDGKGVTITTQNHGVLSWIFGGRTAKEGKDFEKQEDGALVITAEDVTFEDVKATDKESGVKFAGIAAYNEDAEVDVTKLPYEKKLTIPGDATKKWYVYIKLVDYADNTSYYALDGKVIVDKTKPVKTDIAFSVDENHSYGKLDIRVKDADSLIKEVKVRLYDGTNAEDENAKDAIKAYGEAVTLDSKANPDTTDLLQLNKDGDSVSNLCYVVVNDEKNKPTGLPENAVVKEAHGAQLSILIEVTDLVGNTVYYDQEGNEIDAKKNEEDGTTFSSLGELGKNTFIIYGNPQVTLTTNESQLIKRDDDYIFTDLTKMTVSFSDMFSGEVGLSFTQDAEAEAADISLGDVSYDTSEHAYVFDEVTLEPKYGLNNIELKVPEGTNVQLNKTTVKKDQIGWFATEDKVTYKGSFIYDNKAPVVYIGINDEIAKKEGNTLYFGLENGVGQKKKPVVTAVIAEDYFYDADKPTLVIRDENKGVVASSNDWKDIGIGTLDSITNSVSGNSVSDNSADNQTESKLYKKEITLELADGKYTADVVYRGAETETAYYNYRAIENVNNKALDAGYADNDEHGDTIVVDYTRPVITWFMTGSKNVYTEADYFKENFTTQFNYEETNGNDPLLKQYFNNKEGEKKALRESLTVSVDGIYQYEITGGVDKAGNHPVYKAHLSNESEVQTLEAVQDLVDKENAEIDARNKAGQEAAEKAGEAFTPEAQYTIDSYLNSLATGLSKEDIEHVEDANEAADKADNADESEGTEYQLISKFKVLDKNVPLVTFKVDGNGKHYDDGDYYNDSFSALFEVSDVNLDTNKVTAEKLFDNGDKSFTNSETLTRTVITGQASKAAADGEAGSDPNASASDQPRTDAESYTYKCEIEKDSANEGYYKFTIEGEDKAGNKIKVESKSGSNNDLGTDEGSFTSGMKALDITAPTFYIATLPGPKSEANAEGETVYYNKEYIDALTAEFIVNEKNLAKDEIWTGYTDPVTTQYRSANPAWETAKNHKGSATDAGKYVSTIAVNDSTNGVYRFVIAGEDKAGNKLVTNDTFQTNRDDYSKTVKHGDGEYWTYNKVIDTKAPTGTIMIGDYYNAAISEGTLSVNKSAPYRKEKSASGTITVNTTELSPVRIDYPLTSTVSGLSQKNAKDYSYDPATFSTSGEQVFYLAVTLTDRAGNTTNAQKTNKIYLDVTAPTEDELAPIISISATANSDAHGPSGNPLFASGVPFHIVVSDPYAPTGANEQNSRSSGLDLVTYEFKVGNQSQGVHPLKTADAEANNRTGSYKDLSLTYVIDTREVVAPAEYNNNDILLIVTATDHSGNTSNREYKFGIDVTAPKIAVSYDNNAAQNGKYFKDPRTATITVTERNFDPNAITVTTNGGSQSGWSYMNYGGNGDNDTWTKTINYSTDGDYTISASGQDLLGNRQNEATVYNGTAPQDFTIDRTAPVITVSFDNNNSYKDSKYYNSDRTATVQIVEHNFNAADARTETTAAIARGDAPSVNVGGWSSSGDNRYQSLGFTQDGDYTITVNYTDMAGNPAAEVKVDEFTVDKTAPEIKFDNTTVQNGVAYNGVIAPRVTFSDTNYDPSGVTFVMTGLKDSRGKNLVVQEVMNDGSGFGGSVSYSDFARIKANDDIYTATGKIIDRAGNESSVSITFSVNRFGSTFDFNNDEVTHDIVNRYYINDPKNVVLREINVNDVIERKVYMTHGTENIELVEGEDYRLTEDMNGGWKQYVYEFFADNFEEEGLYNIIVQTKDNAGNENSNTYEYINENGEKVAPYRLTFLVDKTEPYSEFEGVNTRQTRYYEDALNLMVGITDNVAVARVQIYVDNELVIDLFDTEEDDALSRTLRENNNSVPLTISSKTAPQTIKVITTDAATNTSLENEWTVVVTRNILAQYFYNRPLFFGSLIGVALLILLLILWKRRKDEEKKKKTA